MRVFAWVCFCICALTAGTGCQALRNFAAKSMSQEMGVPGSAGQITAAELDELTRAFADRYVGLLSSTCDAIKKDNPDPVQRREAQELLLNCASNVYDIASNADAFTRMLDLVVVTTLVSQVWIDDDRAGEVFGERGEVLVRALHHGRVEAWALAAQVLRPDQLELLDYTMWDWRQHNPDMVHMPFVRFSNFAIGRGKSATAAVLAAGGFFSNVGKAGRSVDEARLLSERMFYQLKREGTLLRWQVEAAKDDIVATPEVGKHLSDITRLTDQMEQLPKNVATERQALVTALDDRAKTIDGMITRVREALSEAKGAASSVGDAGNSLTQLLAKADTVFGWSAPVATTQPTRPFDVREYTAGMKELTSAMTEMNHVLKTSDGLLSSPQWESKMSQLNDSADGRMKVAVAQSQIITDRMFRQLYIAMGVFFALLILYRLMGYFLNRRLTLVHSTRGKPGQNGDQPHLPPRQNEVSTLTRTLPLILASLTVLTLTGCAFLEGAGPRGANSRDSAKAPTASLPKSIDAAQVSAADTIPPYEPLTGLLGNITSIGDATTTNLAARAITEFRRIYPNVTHNATAGLTSIGAVALLRGQADIVPMSRPFTPAEIAAFQKKFGYPPTEIKVAADALAIYVDKRNPLPGLTLAQLDGIFSRTQLRGGKAIDTWGDAGLDGNWSNRPIVLFGYGPGDGVHQTFRQLVLEGGEFRLSMKYAPAGSSIVQGVAADPEAIGCASVFFASKRVRAVPLADADGNFYLPTAENVRAHKYPLTRFLTICVNKPPGKRLPPATAEFLRFLLSAEGQQIVAEGHIVRLDAATAGEGRRAIQ
jgi:phosphate transport system substrate-binding protein